MSDNQLVLFDYAALDTETRIVVQQRTRELRDEQQVLQGLIRQTGESIWRTGDILRDVQERLERGQFLLWLKEEFPSLSRTSAYRFINVAKRFKFPTVGNLDASLNALYLLAAPSTPEEAREEAIALAQIEHLTTSKAQALITSHTPINSRPAGVRSFDPDADPSAGDPPKPASFSVPTPAQQSVTDFVQQRHASPNGHLPSRQDELTETHPHYATEGNPAFCGKCGEYHIHWKAISGAFWRCLKCEARGERTEIADDAMDIETAEDRAAALSLIRHRNGRGRKMPQNNSKNPARDHCQTPPYGLIPLLPYLPKDQTIWESAAGEGWMVEALRNQGYTVVPSDLLTGQDFFHYEPDVWGIQTTNVPFSKSYHWLKRSYDLKKPFALLMPAVLYFNATPIPWFDEYGIEVIAPYPRIDFKMPNLGWNGSGAQFPTAWFTWGLNIGREFTRVNIKEAKRAFKSSLKVPTQP